MTKWTVLICTATLMASCDRPSRYSEYGTEDECAPEFVGGVLSADNGYLWEHPDLIEARRKHAEEIEGAKNTDKRKRKSKRKNRRNRTRNAKTKN